MYWKVTGPDWNKKSMFTLVHMATIMKYYQIKVKIRLKLYIILSKIKIPENLNLKSQFHNIPI